MNGREREKERGRDSKPNLPLHSIPFFCSFAFSLCAWVCVRMRVWMYDVCIDEFPFWLCFSPYKCSINLFRIACDTFPLWYKQANIELHLIKNDYFSWSLRQTLTTMAPGIKTTGEKKSFYRIHKKPMRALKWGEKMKRAQRHQKR